MKRRSQTKGEWGPQARGARWRAGRHASAGPSRVRRGVGARVPQGENPAKTLRLPHARRLAGSCVGVRARCRHGGGRPLGRAETGGTKAWCPAGKSASLHCEGVPEKKTETKRGECGAGAGERGRGEERGRGRRTRRGADKRADGRARSLHRRGARSLALARAGARRRPAAASSGVHARVRACGRACARACVHACVRACVRVGCPRVPGGPVPARLRSATAAGPSPRLYG